jgi:glycosyltransferase involved in cell wall biosynthesis
MRILWFANAPSDEAFVYLMGRTQNQASWIVALHEEISQKDDIEMGFVFQWSVKKLSTFKIGKTLYFIVPTEFSFFDRIVNNYLHSVDSEKQLAMYLEIVKEFNPDVIHIFGTENNFGLIQKITSIPCVVQMQGIINNYRLYYFQSISSKIVLRYSGFIKLLKRSTYFDHFLKFNKQAIREKTILSYTKNVIGFTEFDKRIANLLGNEINYYHIPWLLRRPFYIDKWEYPNQKRFRVIAVMNPNIYKGLETVYRVSMILNELFPNRFEFVVAGIPKASIVNKLTLKSLKISNQNASNINFLGNIDADKLKCELLSSHVYLHPSLCDTSPNSICEAMIMGMPVISTNVGGIPSLIEDQKTGFLVQSLDYLSIASVLKELMLSPKQCIEIGKNAREIALVKHERQKIVDDTMNIYNSLKLN